MNNEGTPNPSALSDDNARRVRRCIERLGDAEQELRDLASMLGRGGQALALSAIATQVCLARMALEAFVECGSSAITRVAHD